MLEFAVLVLASLDNDSSDMKKDFFERAYQLSDVSSVWSKFTPTLFRLDFFFLVLATAIEPMN